MSDHPSPHPDVGGYVVGGLGPGETEHFEAHLGTCADCRAEVAELAPLRAVLAEATALTGPPPELQARTFELLGREVQRSRARATNGRLLVAAAVVVVFAVAGFALGAGGGGAPAFELALAAPDGGPAGGTAKLRRTATGVAIELVVERLPGTPGGGHYECWYVGADDSVTEPERVSAGTFTVPTSGRATVRMVTAADPERYPRVEVTLEPGDGDPRPSRSVVLASRPPQPGGGARPG